MGKFVQYLRGACASFVWLVGVPFINAGIAFRAKSVVDARGYMARHFSRFLKTCKFQVEISGNPPKAGQGAVLIYNETSFADVAAYGAELWDYVDRAAAAELYGYLPFGKVAMRKAQVELVSRGNRQATEKLLQKMVFAVENGERVAWGGEGRLVGHDGIGRFKVGGSLIAIRSKKPIVPVVFYGGHKAMPLGSVRARPGKIRIHFGDPVSPSGFGEDDARNLADRVQAAASEIYENLRSEEAGASTELT